MRSELAHAISHGVHVMLIAAATKTVVLKFKTSGKSSRFAARITSVRFMHPCKDVSVINISMHTMI